VSARYPTPTQCNLVRVCSGAANETSTAYSPNQDFLGQDYCETRFECELMNGSTASTVLKANVEVIPHP
jgi:hypothetical protein